MVITRPANNHSFFCPVMVLSSPQIWWPGAAWCQLNNSSLAPSLSGTLASRPSHARGHLPLPFPRLIGSAIEILPAIRYEAVIERDPSQCLLQEPRGRADDAARPTIR